MAFHSFSLHRVLFFQGGWLPGNRKYNWRNGFIWHESLKQGEGTEHQAEDQFEKSSFVQVIAEKATQDILFLHPFLLCFLLLQERKMSIVLAAPWSWKAAFLGWCLPSKKHLYSSHMLAGAGGGNLLDCASQVPGCSTPTSLTPFLPILFFSLFLLPPLTAMELKSIFF